MVLQVFQAKGFSMSIAEAYTALMNLNPQDPYRRYKAAGALGGSVASGFLILRNGVYKRVR